MRNKGETVFCCRRNRAGFRGQEVKSSIRINCIKCIEKRERTENILHLSRF